MALKPSTACLNYWAEAKGSAYPKVDISFPEIEKFDHLPPARVEGPSAFVSIMGCSKYCSYCVVPIPVAKKFPAPLKMC